MNCPKCGGLRTVKNGYKMLANGKKLQRNQCMCCGKYFISEIEKAQKTQALEDFF